jgi:hypothetical protein
VRLRASVAGLFGITLATAGCGLLELGPDCPRTVEEAMAVEWDDQIVGGGYAIRFVPSPDDPAFRGYDINLTRPVSDRADLDTYFLPIAAPIPGIQDGMPVLFIGERVDPFGPTSLRAGACPALTPTTEADVTNRFGD